MINILIAAFAAVICIFVNVSSISYIKGQIRRQQLSQDGDGLIASLEAHINAKYSEAAGAVGVLRKHCTDTTVYMANPLVNPSCLTERFEDIFGFPPETTVPELKSKLNLGLGLATNDRFSVTVDMTLYKTDPVSPNKFLKVSGISPLLELNHVNIVILVFVPNPMHAEMKTIIRRLEYVLVI